MPTWWKRRCGSARPSSAPSAMIRPARSHYDSFERNGHHWGSASTRPRTQRDEVFAPPAAPEAPAVRDEPAVCAWTGNTWITDMRHFLDPSAVSYTHLRAHETDSYLVCRLLLEKK